MHAKEMLHSLKNSDDRILNDSNDIGRGVRYVGSDGFVRRCPEVIFVTGSVYEQSTWRGDGDIGDKTHVSVTRKRAEMTPS